MLTLSRHLGTLTTVWVVSLTDYKLTPQSGLRPSTMTAGLEFDRRARDFSARIRQSVLYSTDDLQSGHAATCFGRNQLMPGSISLSLLDAGHTNDLHINTACGPPRSFRHASTCPRLDHPASGRIPVTPRTCIRRASPCRLRTCWFRFGFPVKG